MKREQKGCTVLSFQLKKPRQKAKKKVNCRGASERVKECLVLCDSRKKETNKRRKEGARNKMPNWGNRKSPQKTTPPGEERKRWNSGRKKNAVWKMSNSVEITHRC